MGGGGGGGGGDGRAGCGYGNELGSELACFDDAGGGEVVATTSTTNDEGDEHADGKGRGGYEKESE